MFNEKKLETPNISTLMTNRLHALELPSRRDSVPMVELKVTQQMVQETVKDMDVESSKIRCYKKYLQNNAIDADKKTSK